jgi:hypothetical protein
MYVTYLKWFAQGFEPVTGTVPRFALLLSYDNTTKGTEPKSALLLSYDNTTKPLPRLNGIMVLSLIIRGTSATRPTRSSPNSRPQIIKCFSELEACR